MFSSLSEVKTSTRTIFVANSPASLFLHTSVQLDCISVSTGLSSGFVRVLFSFFLLQCNRARCRSLLHSEHLISALQFLAMWSGRRHRKQSPDFFNHSNLSCKGLRAKVLQSFRSWPSQMWNLQCFLSPTSTSPFRILPSSNYFLS